MNPKGSFVPNLMGVISILFLAILSVFVLKGLYLVKTDLYIPLSFGLIIGCSFIFVMERLSPEKREWNVHLNEMAPHFFYYLAGSITFKLILDPIISKFPSNPLELDSHWLAQFIISFLYFEFSGFLFHYLSHRFDFLWKWHKVHHNTPKLNFFSNNVAHFISILLSAVLIIGPLGIMGVDPRIILFIVYLGGQFNFFSHSNIKAKLGVFNFFIVGPNYHRWHHEISSQYKLNFGIVTPWFDILFGMAKFYQYPPKSIGLPETEYLPNWKHFFRIHFPFLFSSKIMPPQQEER